MKKTMMLLMGICTLDTVVANSQQNLIVNGDFADNPCTRAWCSYNTPNQVKGWIPESHIEVGQGRHYNQYLGKQKVVDLAVNSNGCIRQDIKSLRPGVYQLTFEYASRSNSLSSDCQFQVSFNNEILKRITPLGDKIQTDTIEIEVNTECEGSVKFCSVGQNNFYGAVLKSVRLVPKNSAAAINYPNTSVSPYNPGEDLIINGKFTENSCQQEFCQYNYVQFNSVKNWVAFPALEIGYGSKYNRFLGRERVVQLPRPNLNCISQVVRYLQPGTYQVDYEYAAQSDTNPSNSNFNVMFNDRTIKQVRPIDDRIQSDTVDIELSDRTEGILRFCSIGNTNNKRAILRSVRMRRKNDNLAQNQMPIQLDSHTNRCLQKQYQFKGGDIAISFNYQIISKANIQNSAVFLVLNGNPIYKVLPLNNGKKIKVQGQITQGLHTVGFCALGSPLQEPHQVVISNLVINQRR